MHNADTIAAIASPPGRSPRALLRLSGPATLDALRDMGIANDRAGAHAVRLSLTDDLSLPVLTIVWRAPRSYTGEDGAEILFPGNPVLAQRVLDRALRAPGVRPATPGEFTARAYLAGKLTLAQAEGVAATIEADSAQDLRAARDLLAGAAGERAHARTEELATLLALVEAGIDFTDQEDVVPIAPADLRARLGTLARALDDEAGGPAHAEARAERPRVVLAGPPNAGKSTLFNALLGRERAVVSDRAGTTRDALVEPLETASGPVDLIDLAGLGERAVDALDADAQRAAREHIETADAVIACDPAGRFESAADHPRVIRVRTKGDLPSAAPMVAGELGVCAIDSAGLEPLRRAIADAVFAGARSGRSGALARRDTAARRAARSARDAAELIDPDARAFKAPEVVAGELRAALDALGEITGAVPPDEVIGRIFSTFCVGK